MLKAVQKFDDDVNILIEYFYEKLTEEEDESYQQVTVPGGFVVDLKHMKILNVNDPKMQQKVERADTTDNRTRPIDNASSRWSDSNILQEKVDLDYKVEN